MTKSDFQVSTATRVAAPAFPLDLSCDPSCKRKRKTADIIDPSTSLSTVVLPKEHSEKFISPWLRFAFYYLKSHAAQSGGFLE